MISTVLRKRNHLASGRLNVVEVTIQDEIYQAGGMGITYARLGMGAVDLVMPTPAAGYVFEYDVDTKKLKAYVPLADPDKLTAEHITRLATFTGVEVKGAENETNMDDETSTLPTNGSEVSTSGLVAADGALLLTTFTNQPDMPRNICVAVKGAYGDSTLPLGNEKFLLDLGGADDGTFRLGDGENWTDPIAYNADDATIYAAIHGDLRFVEADVTVDTEIADRVIIFEGYVGVSGLVFDGSDLDNATDPSLTHEREYSPVTFTVRGELFGHEVVDEIKLAFSEETLDADNYLYGYTTVPFTKLTRVECLDFEAAQENLIVYVGVGAVVALPNEVVEGDVEVNLDGEPVTRHAGNILGRSVARAVIGTATNNITLELSDIFGEAGNDVKLVIEKNEAEELEVEFEDNVLTVKLSVDSDGDLEDAENTLALIKTDIDDLDGRPFITSVTGSDATVMGAAHMKEEYFSGGAERVFGTVELEELDDDDNFTVLYKPVPLVTNVASQELQEGKSITATTRMLVVGV